MDDATDEPVPGRHNDLTDVSGIRVGHHHRRGAGWLTGTTVVLPPEGTVGSVDVRGAAPSTRETDALGPTALVEVVHAVVLSGGSSYGLTTASGVMEWLGERQIGFPVGDGPGEVVPIVPAACLFDLGAGGRFDARPDAAFGRAAADAASTRRIRQGAVGAGTGAHAGALKGGVGSASVVLVGGITVAALVAVNPGGSVVDPSTGELWGARHLLAGEIPGLRRPSAADLQRARADGYTDLRAGGRPAAARRPPAGAAGSERGSPAGAAGSERGSPAGAAGSERGSPAGAAGSERGSPAGAVGSERGSPAGGAAGAYGGSGRNTVLAVVATDAALGKGPCARLATAGHDGMARAIRPIHTMTDGDVVFALATGGRDLPAPSLPGPRWPTALRAVQLSGLMEAAADVVARAVVHAVVAAGSAGGMPGYLQRYPSARPSPPGPGRGGRR